MTGSPYSPNKIFRHQRVLDAIAAGEHVAPIFLVLLPTNRCNQACKMCAYRIPGYYSNESFNPQDEIPTEKLLEIVSDCAAMGVKAIEISGGGEPTLHPGFFPMCEAILDRDIDLAIVTNGSCWTEQHTELAFLAKWVRFSLEASTPETYASYRKSTPETYFCVRQSIRDLCSYRTPASDLVVGVGFTVVVDNWMEVAEATRNAREDGADNIRISAAFQPAGAEYFKDFHAEAAALCKEAESLSTDRFRVFNNFGDRMSDLTIGHPTYSECLFQRVSVEIGADCNVYRCCTLLYNRRGRLGSLANQRLSTMWFSEETRRLLSSIDARSCPHCLFNNKNAAISYAICDNPAHVNFV